MLSMFKNLLNKIEELIRIKKEYIEKLNSTHLILSEYKLCHKVTNNTHILTLIEMSEAESLKSFLIKEINNNGLNNIERDLISRVLNECLFEKIKKLKSDNTKDVI